MKNKKGFVLTETLVVVVFLVSIFTFVYISVIPLIGKYEDSINRNGNIDIVYKLYNVRKMINSDVNKELVINSTFNSLTGSELCNMLSNSNYCNIMFEYLELNPANCIIAYADNINGRLSSFGSITADTNNEIREYITKYTSFDLPVLILLDKDSHLIAHLSAD